MGFYVYPNNGISKTIFKSHSIIVVVYKDAIILLTLLYKIQTNYQTMFLQRKIIKQNIIYIISLSTEFTASELNIL